MKVEEESAKTGLHLNTKTKIMTTKETHNFNIDNEDNEIVKDFAYLGSVNSNGDCSQEIKRRLRFRRIGKDHQEQRCIIRYQG